MRVLETPLPGVMLVVPPVHADARGCFLETWSAARDAALGADRPFAQDNLSVSRRGVLRGLHLQEPYGQGKLVSVLHGVVYDVAVDVRVGSPHFGRWFGVRLSRDPFQQLWIPPGFAHGFLALTDEAVLAYKVTDAYRPDAELTIAWDDPTLGIAWPLEAGHAPILSRRDAAAPRLAELPRERLPQFRAGDGRSEATRSRTSVGGAA